MKPPVIENPKAATGMQRYGQKILTMFFWILLAVLLRPLITLLAWILGGHLFFDAMHLDGGLWQNLRVPLSYLAVIAAIAAVLIGWASYNLLRFRRRERRMNPPEGVTPKELAEFFGIKEDVVLHLQSSRRIVISHDEKGTLFVD